MGVICPIVKVWVDHLTRLALPVLLFSGRAWDIQDEINSGRKGYGYSGVDPKQDANSLPKPLTGMVWPVLRDIDQDSPK